LGRIGNRIGKSSATHYSTGDLSVPLFARPAAASDTLAP
jgi:hypothetical protein